MRPTRTLQGGRASRKSLPKGPNGLPLCRWCELEIIAKRRRTFCSDYCVHQWRLRTDTVTVYAALKRSRGAARAAGLRLYGMKSIAARRSLWDADHILPVVEGGG